MTASPPIPAVAARWAQSRPSTVYVPGDSGRYPDERDRFQLAFHRSKHVIRAMFLGNGAGKTTVSGVEVDWWIGHDHPYRPTPAKRVTVIWLALKFGQMDLLRPQLERRCFREGWTWNESKHRYVWPDRGRDSPDRGGVLQIVSNDADWETLQGTPPDLVVMDEECEERYFVELQMRRRVDSQTEFVIAATATKGKTWMYKHVYLPWLTANGLHDGDEEGIRRAMRDQKHEWIWCWPRGGIGDNPGSTQADYRWYNEQVAYSSTAEKLVRTRGGFVDLNQSPVFDHSALDDIDRWRIADGRPGCDGVLEPVLTPIMRRNPSKRHEYQFIPNGGEFLGGRITIYEPPRDATYVIGADFAHGLATGDYDAAVVLRNGDDGRAVQVAEAHGHWGTLLMTQVLFALGWYYDEALIVGEANSMGLSVLQRLYQELGYVRQYFREAKRDAQATPKSDRLGYFKTADSKLVPRLQWAVAPVDMDSGVRQPPILRVRSPFLLEELRRYQRRPRSKQADLVGTRDKDLIMEAETGYHDDLVSAAAAAITGWIELPDFAKPLPEYPGGSLGQVLNHKEVLQPSVKAKAFAFSR